MYRLFRTLTIAAWLIGTSLSVAAADEKSFYLEDGDRVVFYGDSITAGGGYVRCVEAYLLTRFPDRKFEIINHGISSETISGTSETDHTPRRPWALERFDRDIQAWKPTVVVACFGMNDGNYHPFDEERFQKYQAGIRTLIKRVRDECGARLTIMTPPPFDPYQRKNGDPQAKEFGYKFAYIGYDETLAKYAAWLTTLREQNVLVVDLHTAMSEYVTERRKTQVSFTLSPDAIHPNAAGHLLMAHTLLKAWNADAPPAEKTETVASHIRRRTVAVPWPIDPAVDPESLPTLLGADSPGRLIYAVGGLKPGRYRIGERVVTGNAAAVAELAQTRLLGDFSSEELAKGIDLARLSTYSGKLLADRAWEQINDAHKIVYGAWRKAIAAGENGQADDSSLVTMRNEVRKLCAPYVSELTLTPIEP